MRTGRELQSLKMAVEVVDDAGEVAVDVYLSIRWFDLQPQPACGTGGVERIPRVRRVTAVAVSDQSGA